MYTYFKIETAVAQKLNDDGLSEDLSTGRILSGKEYGGTGLISEKTEAFYAELNEGARATTNSYSSTVDLLQYIYAVLVAKNHQKVRSKCLVHEFPFTDIF